MYVIKCNKHVIECDSFYTVLNSLEFKEMCFLKEIWKYPLDTFAYQRQIIILLT